MYVLIIDEGNWSSDLSGLVMEDCINVARCRTLYTSLIVCLTLFLNWQEREYQKTMKLSLRMVLLSSMRLGGASKENPKANPELPAVDVSNCSLAFSLTPTR